MIDNNRPRAPDRFQVLVAEDNPGDIGLVREALKIHKVDCTLHVISDGAQAISFIKQLDADPGRAGLDLVLLDMHLPKHDGEEILKCLRSTQRCALVPVIVMTGADFSLVEQKAGKPEALSYFRKSSNLDEFLQLGLVVRRILNGERDVIPAKADARGAA